MSSARQMECDQHGEAFRTYICGHLASNPAQTWYSTVPSPDNGWADSWCSLCHVAYLRKGNGKKKARGPENEAVL